MVDLRPARTCYALTGQRAAHCHCSVAQHRNILRRKFHRRSLCEEKPIAPPSHIAGDGAKPLHLNAHARKVPVALNILHRHIVR